VRRPPLHEPAIPLGQYHDGAAHMRPGWARRPSRQRPRIRELPEGPAGERDRTGGAIGADRSADRLPQLHHRLVERTGALSWQDRDERRLEPSAHVSVPDVPCLPCPACRDPQAVRLERDLGPVERDRRHGPRDVRADPGEPFELGNGGREVPPVVPEDRAGRFVEVVGACVVAGALPELEHPRTGSVRERHDRRERREEPLEVRAGLGDPRLLEENLRHPDAVRVAVPPPGERATVGFEPAEQRRRKRGRKTGHARRSGPHGRTVVPDERGT